MDCSDWASKFEVEASKMKSSLDKRWQEIKAKWEKVDCILIINIIIFTIFIITIAILTVTIFIINKEIKAKWEQVGLNYRRAFF